MPDHGTDALLTVRGLTTHFHVEGRVVAAVEDVSFTVAPGGRFGIVGESGSGKTVTARSILDLIDPPGRIEAGEVLFKGRDLRSASAEELRQVRGAEIGMVFQDPLATLNPVLKVGAQIAEVMVAHGLGSGRAVRSRVADLLGAVGIPRPGDRMDDFPHQFSGGMRQRVGIALALCCEPSLLIADEPTTALDMTIQAQILDLLQRLIEERRMAVILITHDLAVIAGFADQVAVMYGGRVVELAARERLFTAPAHPYTRGLLQSVSRLDRPRRRRLPTIGGQPPDPADLPEGCSFHPRCFLGRERDRCHHDRPVLRPIAGRETQTGACHYAEELLAPEGAAR